MTHHGKQKAGTNFLLLVLLLVLGTAVVLQYRERVLDRETIQLLEAQFKISVSHPAPRGAVVRLVRSVVSPGSKLSRLRPRINVTKGRKVLTTGTKTRRLLTPLYHGAPTTHSNQSVSQVPSCASDERFFLYQPSGGWNNQRLILSRALRICKILNRTCLVPMYGAHTSFYQNYNKLGLEKLMRMDRIIDFKLLAGYHAQAFFIGEPFLKFKDMLQQQYPNISKDWTIFEQTPKERREAPLLEGHLYRLAETCNTRVVFFAGSTMWQPFSLIPKSFEEEVIPYFRYAPFFRAVAQDIRNTVIGARPYLSLHLRLEDVSKRFYKRKTPIDVADYFGAKLGRLRRRRNGTKVVRQKRKLYVAHIPGTNLTLIQDLYQTYEILTSSSFSASPVVLEEFDSLFELPLQRQLRNDVLGIVEQLLCITSQGFVGTSKSTFSEYVERVRRYPRRIREMLFQVQTSETTLTTLKL